MKTVFGWLGLVAVLLLVACGGQVVGEAAVSSAVIANEEPMVDSVASKPVDPNRLYAMSDLSQVANTGRPQFLNSFANW